MTAGGRGGGLSASVDALTRPIFFDTNILLYAFGPDDAGRGETALGLVREAMGAERCVFSTQVLVEFYAVAVRKNYLSPDEARDVLGQLSEHRVVPASADSVLRAVELQQRRRMSIWDALVVQSALEAGCATLFSEDLQHGQRFDAADDPKRFLHVIDPFRSSP